MGPTAPMNSIVMGSGQEEEVRQADKIRTNRLTHLLADCTAATIFPSIQRFISLLTNMDRPPLIS